jgi:hypothetical protein
MAVRRSHINFTFHNGFAMGSVNGRQRARPRENLREAAGTVAYVQYHKHSGRQIGRKAGYQFSERFHPSCRSRYRDYVPDGHAEVPHFLFGFATCTRRRQLVLHGT